MLTTEQDRAKMERLSKQALKAFAKQRDVRIHIECINLHSNGTFMEIVWYSAFEEGDVCLSGRTQYWYLAKFVTIDYELVIYPLEVSCSPRQYCRYNITRKEIE